MFLEIEEIKNYFDKLNNDLSHFTNRNDICTPIECVKEMVDSIPLDFWKQKELKILDCCAGNGNFHAYIMTKTNINNLYFNEINPKRVKNIINYFGENINLTTIDFLSFEEKEEYDLVVANPPYAKFNGDKRISKNHNLSRDFIKKALKITKKGGYILFIVPDNWMSYSDRNDLPQILSQYQFIYIDIHGAKKYFPKVGSSFTWFLLRKVENKNEFKVKNNYIIKDEQICKIKKGVKFIPLYYSKLVEQILEKTIWNEKLPKYKIETSSYLHKHTKNSFLKDCPDNQHKYKIIHTPSQIVWSKIPHKYQKEYKVFLSLTNQYKTFIDNCGMTQSVAFIRCKNFCEALKIKKELDDDVYLFLNNITRYGNFNNIRVLQNFPLLSYIKLNKEEKELIKRFNLNYLKSGKNK